MDSNGNFMVKSKFQNVHDVIIMQKTEYKLVWIYVARAVFDEMSTIISHMVFLRSYYFTVVA